MGKKSKFKLNPSLPKPLYEQFADQILSRIRRGEYASGKLLPPINALEQMVNASRITVVRALKELANLGVISARGTRGYFVNPQENPVYVGFIVPLHTVFMSIYGKMHAALQLAVRRRYGTLVVGSSEEQPHVFRDRITEMVYGQGIRKLAVVPPSDNHTSRVHPESLEVLREIAAVPNMRLVVMDRDVEPDGFSVLRQNREHGYRQAMALLAGRGYRNILLLNPDEAVEAAYQAVQPQLHGARVTWHQEDRLSQQEIMERALALAADAVILGDLPASLLLEHYGSVPFALVGYDGSDFVDACPVRMTHVDSNLKEMGRTAFGILESGQENVNRLIDPCVRLGDTTPFRESNPTLAVDSRAS